MFEMGLKSFYQLDTTYFHLSSKFAWLIHYLLLGLNDFVYLNPLKCQFCTNFNHVCDFNIQNNNKRTLKWA